MKRAAILIGLASLLCGCAGNRDDISPVTEGYFMLVELGHRDPIDFDAVRTVFRNDLQPFVTLVDFATTRNFYTVLDSARNGTDPDFHMESINRLLLKAWIRGLGTQLWSLRRQTNAFQYRKEYEDLKTCSDCLIPFLSQQQRQAGLESDLAALCRNGINRLPAPPAKDGLRDSTTSALRDSVFKAAGDSIFKALGIACLAANFYDLKSYETGGKTDSAKCARRDLTKHALCDPVLWMIKDKVQQKALAKELYAGCGEFNTETVRQTMRAVFPEYAFLGPSDTGTQEAE